MSPHQRHIDRRGKPWTPHDVLVLRDLVATHRPAGIARRLGRSESGIRQAMARHRAGPTVEGRYLTSTHAAVLAAVTPQGLTKAARAGRVKARRVPGGRWWLFLPQDVEEFARRRDATR